LTIEQVEHLEQPPQPEDRPVRARAGGLEVADRGDDAADPHAAHERYARQVDIHLVHSRFEQALQLFGKRRGAVRVEVPGEPQPSPALALGLLNVGDAQCRSRFRVRWAHDGISFQNARRLPVPSKSCDRESRMLKTMCRP
jgi:hypothetical protein